MQNIEEERTDAELWGRCQSGDPSAFVVLFERHSDALYRFCLYRSDSVADAEDLTSLVFFTAWKRRASLDVAAGRSFLPLLYGIGGYVVSHHHRSSRRGRRAFSRLVPSSSHQVDAADEVAERLVIEEHAKLARAALAALPKGQRQVAELCLVGSVDVQSAADSLGLPVGTVKSRLARVRQQLRITLEPVIGVDESEGPE